MNSHLRTVSVVFVAVLLLCIVAVSASAATSAAGIKEKLDALTAVYSDGTYFTSDGLECTSSYDDRCNIKYIPERGELPLGADVVYCDGQGESWSCRAFANYVWYYIFSCHYTNSANTISDDSPVLGDFVKFNGEAHSAIFLWQDSNYYYVYDANGDHKCGVKFERAFNKQYWHISTVSHAYNYGTVCDSAEPAFTCPDTSVYRLSNVATGRILCDGFTLNTVENAEESATKVIFSTGSAGFTISSELNPKTYLTLTQDGELTTGTKANTAARWKILVIGDKFFIHNAKYPEYVLYDKSGKLAVGKYTGKSRQIWSLDHLTHNYIAEVIEAPTCTESGITKFVCSCGKEYIEYTVALDHDWQTETVEATASTCGYTKNVCSRCGAITRTDFTERTGNDTVNTDTVKVLGDTVLVNPCVTEAELNELFPDYVSDKEAGMKLTGAKISSVFDRREYYVIVAGDTNGNGVITVADARYTLRVAVGLSEASEYQTLSADWTSDGIIDVTDARLELRLAMGLETADSLFENIYISKL